MDVIEEGEFGKYLSGIEKDKVIQLFENEMNKMIYINDETKLNEFENNYRLNNRKDTFEINCTKVQQLNLCQAFGRSQNVTAKIEKYLINKSNKNDGFVNLPIFIKYLSMIVKPRLKYEKFCQVLQSLGV